MTSNGGAPVWRSQLVEYVRWEAKPTEKFSHQARLYALTERIGVGEIYDSDVVFAAAWLHDMGVFEGHRPAEAGELARWKATPYSMEKAREVLGRLPFPAEKIEAAVECIRTHEVHEEPQTLEGTLLRDADLLEQLGAVGVVRTVCKIGRDTRFHTFADAAATLERALQRLPGEIRLPQARALAGERVAALRGFLEALREEGGDLLA